MTMRPVLAVLAALPMCACLAAAPLAPELPGVWATANAVFIHEILYGGTAIYLTADGIGALAGAPLPVRECGPGIACNPVVGFPFKATVDSADAHHLRIVSAIPGTGPQVQLAVDYDAAAGTLTLHGERETTVLVRHADRVDPQFEAQLRQLVRPK